jgi:hypothetical protein
VFTSETCTQAGRDSGSNSSYKFSVVTPVYLVIIVLDLIEHMRSPMRSELQIQLSNITTTLGLAMVRVHSLLLAANTPYETDLCSLLFLPHAYESPVILIDPLLFLRSYCSACILNVNCVSASIRDDLFALLRLNMAGASRCIHLMKLFFRLRARM